MKKIKILKPCLGAYKMAYFGGEEIEVNEALAQDMIENGFAIEVESIIEVSEKKPTKEKATKK